MGDVSEELQKILRRRRLLSEGTPVVKHLPQMDNLYREMHNVFKKKGLHKDFETDVGDQTDVPFPRTKAQYQQTAQVHPSPSSQTINPLNPTNAVYQQVAAVPPPKSPQKTNIFTPQTKAQYHQIAQVHPAPCPQTIVPLNPTNVIYQQVAAVPPPQSHQTYFQPAPTNAQYYQLSPVTYPTSFQKHVYPNFTNGQYRQTRLPSPGPSTPIQQKNIGMSNPAYLTQYIEGPQPVTSCQSQPQSEECQMSEYSGSDCLVYKEAKAEIVFLECGHMVSCDGCSQRLEMCPVCRAAISRRIRVLKS